MRLKRFLTAVLVLVCLSVYGQSETALKRQAERDLRAALKSALIETDADPSPAGLPGADRLSDTERAVAEVSALARASRVCLEKGNRERSNRRLEQVRSSAQRALEDLPDEANEERGRVYYHLGIAEERVAFDPLAAAKAYKQALEVQPENGEYQRRLAKMKVRLRIRGQLDQIGETEEQP